MDKIRVESHIVLGHVTVHKVFSTQGIHDQSICCWHFPVITSLAANETAHVTAQVF